MSYCLTCIKNTFFLKTPAEGRHELRNIPTFDFKHRTTFYEKSPLYVGHKIFQTLPHAMQKETRHNIFQNLLKEHLINLAPYNVKFLL